MVRAAPLLFTFCLAAQAGFAQTPATPIVSTEATTLNYDVDLALAYIDRLTRSDSDMVVDADSFTLAAPDKPRTFGLRRALFAIDWRSIKGTRLSIVLRPDAMNRVQQDGLTTPAREVDTRAGEPYRLAPTIRLLDSYQITINALSSLSASVGVFDQLATPLRSYPELLGFGLEVRFPAKFSALRLRWRDQAEAAPTGAIPPARIRADLYVMQGNEDRAESLVKKNRTADTAPAASDPYTGGASYVSFSPSPRSEIGLLAGFDDSAEAGGKRNEVFGSLGGKTAWRIGTVEGNVGLDVRYAKETWRSTTTEIAARTQISETLTGSARVAPRAWVLLGFANGQSDRPASALEQDKLTTVSGWDVEAGMLTSLGAGLDFQFMLSQEKRTQKTESVSGEQGGFVTDDGAHSTVHRLGLELRYLLNDNA